MFQSGIRVGVNGSRKTLDDEFANLVLSRCHPRPLKKLISSHLNRRTGLDRNLHNFQGKSPTASLPQTKRWLSNSGTTEDTPLTPVNSSSLKQAA